MKPYLIITLLLLTNYYSQAQSLLWANRIGNKYEDNVSALTVDNTTNVITTGIFGGKMDFNSDQGIHEMTSRSAADIFILKTDTKGAFVWTKQIELHGKADKYINKATAITTDAEDNLYITGFFRDSADFDPGPEIYMLKSNGISSGFILKLNKNGDFIWAKSIVGTGTLLNTKMKIDGSNLYIGGAFDSTADFDPGPSVTTLTCVNSYSYDAFLLKLDTAGNFVWVKQIEGDGYQTIADMAIDLDHNIVLTGKFSNATDFDPGPGTYTLTSANDANFITKLDSAGNFIWALPTGGPWIVTDAVGDIYTTGACIESTVDFDPGQGTYNLTSKGSCDVVVQKLDKDGKFIWAKQIGGTDYDEATAIANNANKELYIICGFKGTFLPGGTLPSFGSRGDYDIAIVKMDKNGASLWAGQMGGKGIEFGVAANTDALGNIYLTGFFTDTCDVDPGISNHYLASSYFTDVDIFTLKLHYNVGITDKAQKSFTITPNPASSLLHISDITGITALKLTDIQGRIIRDYLKPVANIDVSMLASGIYLLQLQTSEGVCTHKFVKE